MISARVQDCPTARHAQYLNDADEIDVFVDDNPVNVPAKVICDIGVFLVSASRSLDRMLSFDSEDDAHNGLCASDVREGCKSCRPGNYDIDSLASAASSSPLRPYQTCGISRHDNSQAKNREFDHVVVLWPYTIPNDTEQRRKLLYNAITSAKSSCMVLVQAQRLLEAPPFAA
jgi:hypothetical protein